MCQQVSVSSRWESGKNYQYYIMKLDISLFPNIYIYSETLGQPYHKKEAIKTGGS